MKPSRWSVAAKLRLSRVMTFVCLGGLLYSLSNMGPYASPQANIKWFVRAMILAAVGVTSVIFMYYYREKAKDPVNPDELAVKTLAALAKQKPRDNDP